MRRALGLFHRWLGLFTAVFLAIAGLTGAIISWDHELDAWLNPRLYEALTPATRALTAADALRLAEQLELRQPELRVTYLPLAVEPGHALQLFVAPRVGSARNQAGDLGFNQVALDPSSGHVQGKRQWGAVSLERENVLPFLYRLHYSLHLPHAFGIDAGALFMGIVAVVWTLDCFFALWLSFPSRKVWRKSFAFRFRDGAAKLNFDLHRSGGVWLWLVLLMLAVTAVSMNLRTQVMRPLVGLFSTLSESPFDAAPTGPASEPALDRASIVALAVHSARERGIHAPPGALFYSPEYGVYGVGFFAAGHEHGDGGLGNPWLYFDAQHGKAAGAQLPGTGSAGDLFMQAQFPLHSGRLFGLWGRIFISLMGLVVAMLSATGVVIWARKRSARVRREQRTQAEPAGPPYGALERSVRPEP